MTQITLYIIADAKTSNAYREATLEEIMSGARQALAASIRRGSILSSPRATADFLTARMGRHPHEVFTVIYCQRPYVMALAAFRAPFPGFS